MGQQQLLLVILVTIIVGIATVVAINVFGSAADNANVTAVKQDMLSIATAAQAYYMKPTMMGGGSNDFTNLTFADLGGIPCNVDASDDLACDNANGDYTLSAGGADDITLTADPGGIAGSETLVLEISADNVSWTDDTVGS